MKRLTIGVHACTETLALLVTMAWADGELDDAEKEGVRGAAEVFNLPKNLRTRIDEMLDKPAPLDQLLFDTVSEHDRAFAYVAAVWMAGADDKIDPKEEALLAEIVTRLGISAEQLKTLGPIARDLPKHDGQRSWAQEISSIFQSIPRQIHGIDATEDVEIVFE